MTAPSQQVLRDTIDLYANYREDLWNSPFEMLKSGIKTLSSFVFGKSDDIPNKAVCEALKDDIKTAVNLNTPQAWVDLCNKLIAAGNAAQNDVSKKFSTGQSIRCGTCYSMVNYIVRSFMKGEDELSVGFRNIIATLIEQKKEIALKIANLRKNESSEGVRGLKKDLNAITLQLAYLFDTDSIFEAIDKNLLTHLHRLILSDEERLQLLSNGFDINEEQPYCLQDNTYEIVFIRHFKQFADVEPHVFMQKSMEIEVATTVVKLQTKRVSGQVPLPTARIAHPAITDIDDSYFEDPKDDTKNESTDDTAGNDQPETSDTHSKENAPSQQVAETPVTQSTEPPDNLDDNQDKEEEKEKEKEENARGPKPTRQDKLKAAETSVLPNSLFNNEGKQPSSCVEVKTEEPARRVRNRKGN